MVGYNLLSKRATVIFKRLNYERLMRGYVNMMSNLSGERRQVRTLEVWGDNKYMFAVTRHPRFHLRYEFGGTIRLSRFSDIAGTRN